jgi:hypothetical protein
MYHIKLTINGTALDMSYAGGYLIRTITGLTGASARITTAQHSSGYGEAFVGATVAGLPIRVEGYVLDSDTTAGTLIKQGSSMSSWLEERARLRSTMVTPCIVSPRLLFLQRRQ